VEKCKHLVGGKMHTAEASMEELKINTQEVKEKLVQFIRDEFRAVGFQRAILGISGGVDSALSGALCCEALGKENVIALILPYGRNKSEIDAANAVVSLLKIKSELIDISPMIDTYFKRFPASDRIRRGNKMARERMAILYDHSKFFNALVVGTGNKTEILLGYCTIHGDAACAINPIATLYKCQVRQLASFMGIPSKVVGRRPSAGLWTGQTDEAELGHKYDDMDKLLYYMVDKKLPKNELLNMGFKQIFIEDIALRIERNKFKLSLPKTPTL